MFRTVIVRLESTSPYVQNTLSILREQYLSVARSKKLKRDPKEPKKHNYVRVKVRIEGTTPYLQHKWRRHWHLC